MASSPRSWGFTCTKPYSYSGDFSSTQLIFTNSTKQKVQLHHSNEILGKQLMMWRRILKLSVRTRRSEGRPSRVESSSDGRSFRSSRAHLEPFLVPSVSRCTCSRQGRSPHDGPTTNAVVSSTFTSAVPEGSGRTSGA